MPFASCIFCFDVVENANAAIVIACSSIPDDNTFPGTIIVSCGFVNLFMRDKLTALLCRVGFSKSSAILFQMSAFCVADSFLSSCMSCFITGFVGPVRFVMLL